MVSGGGGESLTFLCARVETHGASWKAPISAIRDAIRNAQRVVREAIATNGGLVVETAGDTVSAAFGSPSDALATAVDLCWTLEEASWGEAGQVRAAVAVHTGGALPHLAPADSPAGALEDEPAARAGLQQTERLLATLAASQVALTAAAAAQVERDLIGEMRLLPLVAGRHLAALGPLYQLKLHAAPEAIPPVRGSPLQEPPVHMTLRSDRASPENAVVRLREASAASHAVVVEPVYTAGGPSSTMRRPTGSSSPARLRLSSGGRHWTSGERPSAASASAAVALLGLAAALIPAWNTAHGATHEPAPAIITPRRLLAGSPAGSTMPALAARIGNADSAVAADTAPVMPGSVADQPAPAEGAPSQERAAPSPILATLIQDAASRRGLDGERLLRIARCESELNPQAVNAHDGSLGVFQFQPSTWREAAPKVGYDGVSPFDPAANVEVAAYLMARGEYWRWTCR
jgi:soluble lytic murein transglycosylase-like protein